MKTFKKIVSLSLCAAMILGTTACSQEEGKNPNGTDTEATTIDLNPVEVGDLVDPNAGKLDNPNLVYFGFYDMRDAGDIKPGVKLFEETYGGKIDYIYVDWASKNDRLTTLITSGDSPDIVDKEDASFPYLMAQNLYTDMTPYFEKYMDEEQWTPAYKDLIERYSWKGAHYFYPFTVNALPNCLIYNADLFSSLNIKNPKEMYLNNEWDWNSFKQSMVDFMNANPDAVGGVYGILPSEIFKTTGVPLIAIEEGNLINNLNNQALDRAASFLMELRKDKLTARGDGMYSNESEPLASGKCGYLAVGQWKITDYCRDYPDRNFEFVPFPRDPYADDYYYGLSSFSYMVVSGAPNPEGAAAFINIMRKCQTDPELQAVVNKSIMTEKNYDQETFDFIMSFNDIDKYSLTLEGFSGFNSEFTDIINDMLTNITFESDEQKNWAQLRNEYEGPINAYLEPYMK